MDVDEVPDRCFEIGVIQFEQSSGRTMSCTLTVWTSGKSRAENLHVVCDETLVGVMVLAEH